MTSEATDASGAAGAHAAAPVPAGPATEARARIARISMDATANPAVRVLRRVLTLSWLARALGIAALVYGFVDAQSKVGDVGPWEPAVRGAIALIAVVVASIWALAETWAAHERRASRRRRGQNQR